MHLPTELWITIFEQLSDPPHHVHIFNQSLQSRENNTRQLQRLQSVCKAWRDMIRPLTYRHMVFHAVTATYHRQELDLYTRTHPTDLWDLDQNADGQSSCRITTLVFNLRKYQEQGHLVNTIRDLCPQLNYLTELACHVPLTADEFKAIVSACQATLCKLLVYLRVFTKPNMLELLTLLHNITDLSLSSDIEFHFELNDLDFPSSTLNLPHLRRLELCFARLGAAFFLAVLLRLPLPSTLQVFKLTLQADRGSNSPGHNVITHKLLSPFLTAHGTHLSTLSMRCPGFQFGAADLLARTPRLRHLGLFASYESIAMFLPLLPRAVEEVTLSTRLGRLHTPWTLMADLLRWLELLPRPNALRVVRIAQETDAMEGEEVVWRRVEGLKVVWRGVLQKMEGVNQDLEMVLELMGRFELIGIKVLDEEEMPLETYIREELERRTAPI